MSERLQTASLLRRLGAMLYDSLIVIALLMLATALLLPFTKGQAIPANTLYYSVYLIAIIFAYFQYSWLNGGQTLGMRAWKIKLKTLNGKPLDIHHTTARFGYAIPSLLLACIGLLWRIVDKQNLSWHDRWSGTYLEYTRSE